MNNSIEEMLQRAEVKVSDERYNVISLSETVWSELQQHPEASPRGTAPFAIFKDPWEITLIVDDADFMSVQEFVVGAKVESGFCLLSFDLELEFEATGVVAAITNIFAEGEIPILSFSSFSRDHFLIKQTHIGKALRVLHGRIGSVC